MRRRRMSGEADETTAYESFTDMLMAAFGCMSVLFLPFILQEISSLSDRSDAQDAAAAAYRAYAEAKTEAEVANQAREAAEKKAQEEKRDALALQQEMAKQLQDKNLRLAVHFVVDRSASMGHGLEFTKKTMALIAELFPHATEQVHVGITFYREGELETLSPRLVEPQATFLAEFAAGIAPQTGWANVSLAIQQGMTELDRFAMRDTRQVLVWVGDQDLFEEEQTGHSQGGIAALRDKVKKWSVADGEKNRRVVCVGSPETPGNVRLEHFCRSLAESCEQHVYAFEARDLMRCVFEASFSDVIQ